MFSRCPASRLLVLLAAAAFSAAWWPAAAQEKDPWAPFEFLVGTWSAVASGQPGEAVAGGTTFSFDLGRKVLVRRNRAEYAPKAGEKAGLVHEDLMIVCRPSGERTFKAVYFDNEGHVIDYLVSIPPTPGSLVFESAGEGKGPRFRLVYASTADGGLSVEFFVAPPGGEMRSYAKGVLKRHT